MTKIETLRAIQKHGQDASFVANVICSRHSYPARKLAGMLNLLSTGHTVTLGADIDTLLIDGYHKDWRYLEYGARVTWPTPEETADELPS